MREAIALDKLPPPAFVETLDAEAIFQEMLADLRSRDTSYNSISEADPAYKVLQIATYRETLLRARLNSDGKSLLLAFARDSNLDHIGITYYHEPRLVVYPGKPDATPPVDPVMEEDDDYRRRLALKPESYSTAGSEGAYIFHGLSADGRVRDIAVDSPTPGGIVVYVLSREGDGTPDDALLRAVETRLSGKTVRPLCESVCVKPATIVKYAVKARIFTYAGPDTSLVLAAAKDVLATYQEQHRRFGQSHTRSGINAALVRPGVQRAEIEQPAHDMACGVGQALYCTGSDVTFAGVAQ